MHLPECANPFPREADMVIADFFESTGGLLLVIFIFGGWIIPTVVNTIATNIRKARESEHLAALKQSMIEKGMSVEDMERVLRASPKPPKEEESPLIDLAEHLAGNVPAEATQEILSLIRTVHPTIQRTAAKSLINLIDHGGDGEQALAAARGLCGPAQPAESGPTDHRFTDDASSFRR
jgi:hypothetical protein